MLRIGKEHAESIFEYETLARSKTYVNREPHILLSEVLAQIWHKLPKTYKPITKAYLKYVKDELTAIYLDEKFENYCSEFLQRHDNLTRNAKSSRIKKLSLKHCELSGEPLESGDVFAHIFSQASHPHLASFWWNGLVIKARIHKELTKRKIVDDIELVEFCSQNRYSLAWLKGFNEEYDKYGTMEDCFYFVESIEQFVN
jgi:hypothetical protein